MKIKAIFTFSLILLTLAFPLSGVDRSESASQLSDSLSLPHANIQQSMDDSIHWILDLPLWVPGFRGALAYGDISLDGRPGGGGGEGDGWLNKLFSTATKLDYFMVGMVRYSRERWYIQGDVFGGQVDNSVDFIYNNQTLVKTKLELIMPRVYVGYIFIDRDLSQGKAGRITSSVTTGIRYYFVSLESTLPLPVEPIDLRTSWIDPYLGVGLKYDFHLFSFSSQLDLAYRGMTSFGNWWFGVRGSYRTGPRFSVNMGWIMHGIEYHHTVLDEDLILNVRFNGPMLGISFHF